MSIADNIECDTASNAPFELGLAVSVVDRQEVEFEASLREAG